MISIAADNEAAKAQASAWLSRLQRADLSASDGLEFEAWLAASPANRAAYRQALAVWHEFEAASDQVLAELAAEPRRPARRAQPTRRWLVAGGGAALAAGLAAAVVLPQLPTESQTQTYATGKGQRQRIALADGSSVDLNAESRLTVRFGGGERRVSLAEGEAIFDVAHDPRRPFTVEAGARSVRVLGTQFDVRRRDGELRVTVARGRVEVRPTAAGDSGRAFTLTRGQRLKIQGGEARLSQVDPAEALAWRSGRLVYRGEPLADVVADINRQFVEQIEVTDPELARMPITGVIVLDDHPSVIARLSLMLPVRSVPSEGGLLLLRK